MVGIVGRPNNKKRKQISKSHGASNLLATPRVLENSLDEAFLQR